MVGESAPDTPSDLQETTLRLFLALRLLRPAWAGALLVGVGLGQSGGALALASRAAGAAALFLEDDPALLRRAQREGCSTFTVTTVQEVIRILKNEIRQGRPIAVALRQGPAEAMAEMLRRGLQPQALAFSRPPSETEQSYASEFQQRGADKLAGVGLVPGSNTVDLERVLSTALAIRWRFRIDAAETLQERRSRDEELLAAASHDRSGDPLAGLAAEWLRVAPLLLPRTLSRSALLPTDRHGLESAAEDGDFCS